MSAPPRPTGGLRLLAESGTRREADGPSVAEYERLYDESREAAALLVRICEDLGRKIGKTRSSVLWDLQQLVLDVRSEHRR